MISGQFRGDQNIGFLAVDDLFWSQVPMDDDSLHVANKPGFLIPIVSGSFTNGYLFMVIYGCLWFLNINTY